jgi:hypothetical protein
MRRRAIRARLLAALRTASEPVVIDLSERLSLTQDDIDFLLDCASRVSGRDVQLVLIAGSRSNRVLLEVTRIASILPVFNSIADVPGEFLTRATDHAPPVEATLYHGGRQ